MNKELLRFIGNQLGGIRSAVGAECERYEVLPIAESEKIKLFQQITAKLIECEALLDKANRSSKTGL